jgi:hypothetical protein
VRDGRRRDEVDELQPRGSVVEVVEEPLAAAEQHRRDVHLELIDQPGPEVLLRGRRATSDDHVLPGGCLHRALERGLDPVRHEMERGPTLHLERRAGVVGEDEDGVVVRRVLTPPAAPLLVAPRPTHRAEHVPAHDPGADVLVPGRRPLVVEPCRASLAAPVLLAEATGHDHPGV